MVVSEARDDTTAYMLINNIYSLVNFDVCEMVRIFSTLVSYSIVVTDLKEVGITTSLAKIAGQDETRDCFDSIISSPKQVGPHWLSHHASPDHD